MSRKLPRVAQSRLSTMHSNRDTGFRQNCGALYRKSDDSELDVAGFLYFINVSSFQRGIILVEECRVKVAAQFAPRLSHRVAEVEFPSIVHVYAVASATESRE